MRQSRGGFDLDAIGAINVAQDAISRFPQLLAENTVGELFARSYDLASTGLAAVRFIRIDGISLGEPGLGFPEGGGFNLDAIGAVNVADESSSPFPDMLVQNTTGSALARSYDLSDTGLSAVRFIRIDGISAEGGGFDLDAIGAINAVEQVNDLVRFEPDLSTFSTSSNTNGCPDGFVGMFRFEASLTNYSGVTLSNLQVHVAELSAGNLLRTNQALLGEGEQFTIPEKDGFSDGQLGPQESVKVKFTVCLRTKAPFRLFVDVLGAVQPVRNTIRLEALVDGRS